MTCREARRKLSEYAARELSAEDAERVAEHLARCELCRAEAAAYRRTEDGLRALARVEKAPDLTEDLHRRTAAPRARRRRWAWAGALAVPVAVAVLLWPRAAPVETLPVVEHVEVRVPQVPAREVARQKDVAVAEIPPEPVRAPRPAEIQGEAASQARPPEASGKLMVSEAPVEAETMTEGEIAGVSELARQEDVGGVILVVGEPQPVLLSSSCYLEVSFPSGARLVVDQRVERDALGRPRAAQLSYRQVEADSATLNHGG